MADDNQLPKSTLLERVACQHCHTHINAQMK